LSKKSWDDQKKAIAQRDVEADNWGRFLGLRGSQWYAGRQRGVVKLLAVFEGGVEGRGKVQGQLSDSEASQASLGFKRMWLGNEKV
jgi:hypothetical protein